MDSTKKAFRDMLKAPGPALRATSESAQLSETNECPKSYGPSQKFSSISFVPPMP
jgi:hypothetical protein